MKKIKLFTAFVLLAATLAVSAFAAVTVTYDIQSAKTDTNSIDCYKIVATLTDTNGDFRAFAQTVTLDTSIFTPISKKTGNALDLSSGSSTLTTPLYGYYYMNETTEAEVTASCVDASWTVTGSKVELTAETFVTPDNYPANNKAAMSIYFKYAGGKSASNITADSFKVNKITYENGEESTYYYGRDEEEGNYKTNLTVVNSVVPASATTTEYWSVGNGYNIIETDKTQSKANSPVTKKDETKTKLTVSHGGYYQNKDNWGGVASKETYKVDGLQIEVKFEQMPTSTDCWAYIGVLKNPTIFDASSGSNPGYVNLIRYADGNMTVHSTGGNFNTIANVGGTEEFFKITAGDTLRVCFDKNTSGKYDVTYIKNDSDVLKVVNNELDLETALDGEKGYVVVSASCLGSQKDAFKYTVDVAPDKYFIGSIDMKKDDVAYRYKNADGVVDPEIYKATADCTYNFPVLADGSGYTVIVNRGYTAQFIYSVENGVTSLFELGGYILGSGDVSVRTTDPQGIRFFGKANSDVIKSWNGYGIDIRYGFIMTAESEYNNLAEDYVLDMNLVNSGKAKMGIAFSNVSGSEKDLYVSKNETDVTIAGVLYGIPKTKEGVKTVIASRPYFELSGVIIYGEVTKASIYDVAKAIYGKPGYESAQAYAKEIIDIGDGVEEIKIDIGSLYE